MMNDDCRRIADRLASYVDDALPAGERADVERHLGACPPCRTAARQESGARTVVRDQARALREIPLPPGLRSRCEALAREHAVASSRTRFGLRRFAPLTAVMTVVIGFLLFSLATHRSDTVLAAQLTADHAKCFRLFAKGDVPDGDARLIEQQLEGYGWNLHVPPSSAANGVRLIGARRCLYADGPVSHVMYRVGGHDMSLFVLDGVSRSANEVVLFGHRSRLWFVGPSTSGQGLRTYVLVWPVTAGDLSAAVRYVMQEAR